MVLEAAEVAEPLLEAEAVAEPLLEIEEVAEPLLETEEVAVSASDEDCAKAAPTQTERIRDCNFMVNGLGGDQGMEQENKGSVTSKEKCVNKMVTKVKNKNGYIYIKKKKGADSNLFLYM